jgi:4-amino-4-deoxy-L-arabinose transferase-like glycosyltransferase
VNLIPFFVLLFLVSFWRLLSEDGSSGWKWTALAGLSLGVGVQLHAIILLLLPLVIIISAILLFLIEKKNIWKKLLAVLAIALVLNAGQIISEERTGFANSKDFVRGFVSKGDLPESSWQKRLALDVACNAQANTHIISSLGNKKMCDFLYEDNLPDSSYATPINLDQTPLVLVGETISLLFSILGISFLVFYLRGETDKKRKYFLGLILLYGALYFLIMFPIAPGSRMRYFLPIIFMPFIFLSFIFDYLTKRYPKNYIWIISAIVIFLMAANGISLAAYFRLERHW